MKNFMRLTFLLWLTIFIAGTASASTFIKGPALYETPTLTTAVNGVTTLTFSSESNQVLIGATSHTFKLPTGTSLSPTGRYFNFSNRSTAGTLTVQYQDGTTLTTVPFGYQKKIRLRDASTANGVWDVDLVEFLQLAGGTVTGGLGLSGAGTSPTTIPFLDASRKFQSSSVTPTELGFLSGATANIQTQINNAMSGVTGNFVPVTGGSISGTLRIGVAGAVIVNNEQLTVRYTEATGGVQSNIGIAAEMRSTTTTPVTSTGTYTAITGELNRLTSVTVTDTATGMASLSTLSNFVPSAATTYTNSSTDGISGLNVTSPTNSGAGAIAFDWNGVYIRPSSINTGANKRGLRIGDQTGNTNNFAIQTGLGIVRFGDVVTLDSVTANTALIANGTKQVVSSPVTSTELGFLSGATAAVQTQLNTRNVRFLGTANVVKAYIYFNCSSASTVTSQTGAWITSAGNISAGQCNLTYTGITLNGCLTGSPTDNGGVPLILRATVSSGTNIQVDCSTHLGVACTNYDAFIECDGT